MGVKKYYIVRVTSIETISFAMPARIMTPAGQHLWLGEEEGYIGLRAERAAAKKFAKPPSLRTIKEWDGMPWYYRFDISSVQIFEVTERIEIEERPYWTTVLDAREKEAQAKRCDCCGSDDLCICQNEPDRETIAERLNK